LGHRAFTLLEVVIAMLLLGIGLLALMALQIRSIQNNVFSNCTTAACCFARDQVEKLRAASWGDTKDGTFSDMVTDVDPDTGATRMVFTRKWVIQTASSNRLRDLSVTVSWNQDGRPHHIRMNTRIARRQ
jgi:type IV pilus modification protein PilV